MNDYNEAIQEMLKGNKLMIEKLLTSFPRDSTKKGYIKSLNSDGTYNVILNNKEYKSLKALSSIGLSVGKTVWCVIPEGQYSNMFILNAGDYSNGGSGAVNSVNGKTGTVVLTASDVNALPSSTTVPSKTSDLTNDSNFVSDVNYVHTDNNFTTTEKDKLANVSQYTLPIATATTLGGIKSDGSTIEIDANGVAKVKESYLTLNGGTLTGELMIQNGSMTANYSSIEAYGNILAGDSLKTSYSMLGTTRKCTNDGSNINTSAFFTNSDGTSKLVHKRGTNTASDDSYMLFDATGFKVAYSGTKGTAATTNNTYTLMDSNNCYSKTEIDAMFSALKTQLGIS